MHNLPGLAGHLVCSLLAAVGAFVRAGVHPAQQLHLQPGRSARCLGSRSIRRPDIMTTLFGRDFGRARALLALIAIGLISASLATAATSPGTRISNIASVDFEVGGVPNGPQPSNQANLVTRSPAT